MLHRVGPVRKITAGQKRVREHLLRVLSERPDQMRDINLQREFTEENTLRRMQVEEGAGGGSSERDHRTLRTCKAQSRGASRRMTSNVSLQFSKD